MKTAFPLLATLGLLAGCSQSAPADSKATPTVAVRTTAVEYSTAPLPIRASAVLAHRTEADLSFKIGGVVQEVAVRAGDAVAAGQVLARLQPDEIDAQVEQARSALDKARRDLDRTEKLHQNAVATLENLQDARTTVAQAEARLRIAEFNRLHSVIRAPAAGRILRRSAEPDEIVAAGRPILSFAAEAGGWIARAGLAERDLARVRRGNRAEVLCGPAACPTSGRVVQIAAGADLATRTTEIEIALDAAPPGAGSGLVAAATVYPPEVTARPRVPASALIEGDGGAASLFLLESGSTIARRVAVQVETLQGTHAYLRTALPRTARLIVAGGEYLRDGTPVVTVP